MYENLVNLIKNDIYLGISPINLHEPQFNSDDIKYVTDAIESSFVSSSGKFIDSFEEELAAFCGVENALCVSNGTSALHLSMLAAGVNAEDEVITQSLTFVATLNAISYLNAKPIFIDVEMDSFGISPELLKKWIENNTVFKNGRLVNKNSNRNIVACLPMHTFGMPSQIEEILEICTKYNLVLIEDCAESLGSYKNKAHTGSFGQAGILSFNGNKIITTGGGGCIISNDKSFHDKARHLGTTAKIKHRWEFLHDQIGYNYRMPNLNAALGCAQMIRLEEYLNKKVEVAKKYETFFYQYPNIDFIQPNKDSQSNNWLNTIMFQSQKERDQVLHKLHENNIFARPPWRPMHMLDMYKSYHVSELPNTERIYARCLNLPSSPI
jgi:aminotransferase in exopolysaccharide biosynthesis